MASNLSLHVETRKTQLAIPICFSASHTYLQLSGQDSSLRSLLNWAQRVEIIRGIAIGVEWLHGKGVTHRDLKPGNILLDDTWKPKIADFGNAKPLIVDPTDLTLVQTAYD